MSEEGNFSAEGRNNFNVGEERERKGKEGGSRREGAPPKTIDIGHQRKVGDEKSAREYVCGPRSVGRTPLGSCSPLRPSLPVVVVVVRQ